MCPPSVLNQLIVTSWCVLYVVVRTSGYSGQEEASAGVIERELTEAEAEVYLVYVVDLGVLLLVAFIARESLPKRQDVVDAMMTFFFI